MTGAALGPPVDRMEEQRESSFPVSVLEADIEKADIGVAYSGWSSLVEGRDSLLTHQLEHVSGSGSVGTPWAMVPACLPVIAHHGRKLMAVVEEEDRSGVGRHSVADKATGVDMSHVGVGAKSTPDGSEASQAMDEAARGDRSRDRGTRLGFVVAGDAAVSDATAVAELGAAARLARAPFAPAAPFRAPYYGPPYPSCPRLNEDPW